MQILIADALHPAGLRALEEAGHAIEVDASLTGERLAERVRTFGAQVLVVRSTRVTADVLREPALELVVRAGAGVNTIDVDAASELGVFVANCPGKNAVAVAELAVGALVALDRRIPDNVVDARAGRWNKAAYAGAMGLKGRTLALIGLGHIGLAVASRALAFDMKVVAWSRSLIDETAAALGIRRAASAVDAVRGADAVSVHLAAAPETKGLADRAFFEAMKPGALFVNTSRSDVVDEKALRWALEERGIRALVDVLSDEPAAKEAAWTHPLADHPGLYVTHHIGGSTEEAQRSVALEAVRVVRAYAETGGVLHAVNLRESSPATHLLTVRHIDRVGVLASVLDEVRKAHCNVQEMENLVFRGGRAACARIRLIGDPNEDLLQAVHAQEHVLAATVIRL